MSSPTTVTCHEIEQQFEALEHRAQALLEGLDEAQLAWSPSEKRWSIGQGLEHLCTVGEGYLKGIEPALANARAKGWKGDGVSRPGWFERWFIGTLEPPPKRRFKVPSSMTPRGGQTGAELVARFMKLQERFRAVAASAADLDVNRAAFRNPFARIMKLRVGAGLEVNAAHERRHLWQAENVRSSDGFPGGSS